MQLCWQYACNKPPATIREFANLAEIILDEENLQMPNTSMEGLELYFDLLNSILEVKTFFPFLKILMTQTMHCTLRVEKND